MPDPAPTHDAVPAADLRGITKAYGGVTVLDGVDLTLERGVVHALLGENGAGKSTLIKILSGVVTPDSGTIELAGHSVQLDSPRDAMRLGVATLHQELSIVPGLSVAENILLGHRLPTVAGTIRFGRVEQRARELLDELGQHIDVGQDASRLSPVGKTMTAIARALSSDAQVLILDEPTAALTDAETTQLFQVIGRVTARGVAVLYVSHRLEEVVTIATRYTVLRNGVRVATGDIADTTIDGIIAAMVGRSLDALFPPRPATRPAEAADAPIVLQTRGLGGRQVGEVDLAVRAGEIVGIAGLAGSGRSEILRMVAGAQRPRAGEMRLHGHDHHPGSVGAAQRAGIGFVPQERRADGLVPDSIEHNVNLTTLDRHTVARRGAGRLLTSVRRSRRHAHDATARIGVRHRSLSQPVFTLSGGNQQKVVLAKVLATDPTLLLLDEPTRGVDVGTKSEIYHLVRERAATGVAVLVVSSELPELLGLCDRILVMHEGRMVGEFDPLHTTEHDLLLACYRKAT